MDRLSPIASDHRFHTCTGSHAADLLAVARRSGHGERFSVNDETLTRYIPPADPARGGRGRAGMVWADQTDGRRRNLGFEEERIFLGWAIIEVLHHTGIRIEELPNSPHRSFVAYTLPSSGEVIPLLQITRPRPTGSGSSS